jgi:hypothetical protein
VARRGGASARPGNGGAEAGATRARVEWGAGAAGAAHMVRVEQRRCVAEKQRGGRER